VDRQAGRPLLFWAATLSLSVLLVATVSSVTYLPTNDGPEAVFSTHAQNHYNDAASAVLRAQLVPTWQFAAKGFTLLYAPLERFMGWEAGLRVALSVIVLGTAWGFLTLVRAINPERRVLSFLGFPLALTWSFYMGFFAFAIGSAIGLFTLAIVVEQDPKTAKRWGLVALLLLVQAVAHVFSAAVTGALIAGVTLGRGSRQELFGRLGRLVVVGLPAGAVLVLAALTRAPGQVVVAGTVLFTPLRETLTMLPRLLLPGPGLRAFVAAGMLLAVVVAVVSARRRAGGVDRTLALLGIALLVLAIVGPRDVPGWQLMSPRFLPTGALLLVALVPLERARASLRSVMGALVFACAVSSLAMSWALHSRLAAACSDVVDALAVPIERRGLQLPVSLEPACGVTPDPLHSEVPYLANLRHIGALFAVAEGGSTPYLFAGSASAHAFMVRPGGMPVPPVPNTERFWPVFDSTDFKTNDTSRRHVVDELAVLGMFYEGAVVTGARPADFEVWDARGYVTDWRRGSVLLAHFSPCVLDVWMPHDAGTPVFDVGAGERTLMPGLEVAGEPVGALVHFALRGAPCGRVWVHPRWPAPQRACTSAAPSGKIYATVTHAEAAIPCPAVVDRD
jgi:hypothetical protein